jgi:predicted GNAT family acetyltransferase
MQLCRFDNPIAFCDHAEPFLQQNEVAHNLLLRICQQMREENSRLKPSYLATVDVGEQIVAVAIRTPPFPLVLSMVEEIGAIVLLAEDIKNADPEVSGVNAAQAEADLFAEVWHKLTGHSYHLHMALRVHQLTQVQAVSWANGALRLAEERDRQLLANWFIDFEQEALSETRTPENAWDWVGRQIGYRSIYLWENGDRPVSAACGYGASLNVGVVNFVYTPPEFRKHGYATACVAAVSQKLINAGYSYCALFTDLANPTSNKIYRAIGYQPVCDWHHYKFG